MMFLTAGLALSAQNAAKEESESIATFLALNAQQKQAVAKLYSTEEKKMAQNRENGRSAKKPSKAQVEAREKNANKKADHSKAKPAVKHGKEKPTVAQSKHILYMAYGKARKNPAIQQGMKEVLTPEQFSKWNTLGKK